MERRGTRNDEKVLIDVFENFKFRVIVHRDLKLKNIKSEIASRIYLLLIFCIIIY